MGLRRGSLLLGALASVMIGLMTGCSSDHPSRDAGPVNSGQQTTQGPSPTASSAPSSHVPIATVGSDARDRSTFMDLRRIQLRVTQRHVTTRVRFDHATSFDCWYLTVAFGHRDRVIVSENKPELRATAYRTETHQKTVTGHPRVHRTSDRTSAFDISRSDLPDYDTYGPWAALTTTGTCGLAGTFDRLPDHGWVRPTRGG